MPPKKSDREKRIGSVERQRRYRSKLINLTDQVKRWQEVKRLVGAESDGALAKLFINSFFESQNALATTPYGGNSGEAAGNVIRGPQDHREPTNLVLDCETVPDGIQHGDLRRNRQPPRNVGQQPSDHVVCVGFVDFHCIHSLPVNQPFSLKYSSPLARGVVESKTYVIVEQSRVSSITATPIKIDVRGTVNEKLFDPDDWKVWDNLDGEDTNSVVDVSHLKKLLASFKTQSTIPQSMPLVKEESQDFEDISIKIEWDEDEKYDIVADIIYDIIDGVVRQSKVQQARIYDVIDGVVSQSKVEQTHIYDVIDGVVSQSKVEQTHIYDVIDGEVSQSNVQQARIYDVIDGVVSQSKVQQAPIYDVTDGQVSQSKVEQTPSKSKKHSKCKRQSNSKRKSDSQNMYSFPKKPRLLKYEDNRESELPHSTRSRSKGYRISYAEIDSSSDQSDASDLDDIFSDSDITDDEDSIATEDKIQGSNECELTDNSVQKKSKTGKKMDEEDPDFDVRTYFLTQFAKKKLTGAEVDYSEDDSEDQSVMPAKHPSSDNHTDSPASAESSNTDKKTLDRGKVYYDREKVKARMLERKLEERCKRIKVFLKDHPDKYYTEEQVSVERKFRGLQEAEKTFELLVCSICNLFRTSNKVQLETHIEHHLNGDWKCKKCTFEGNSIKEYRKHYKENHPLQPRFKCVICKEKFGIKKRFHEHLVTVHNMLPYVCTLCSTADNPVMFKEEQEHHQHYLEHHKDHMQQCPHCGVHFINQIIERHRCQEETDRSTCDICGKEMRRASIRIHKARVHDNVRPFPCQQCNYAARSSEALRDHVSAKHEGVHHFECDLCQFTCVRKFQLVSHMRTHTGDKPYKCDLCPYAAAWNVQLKEHKQLHGSPIAKECEICGIVVRQGAGYTNHMKKEHSKS